jgi:sugar lactone lactonase YvrE
VFYGPLSDYTAPAALVLDQYGNMTEADGAGLFGFNINTVTTGFSNGNCTVCDEQITKDTGEGLGIDPAGNIYVSDGQTSQQVMRVVPLVGGAPAGSAEYILAGNFYSNGSAGVVPTSGEAFTGDGGYSNPDTVRQEWLGGQFMGSQALGSGLYGQSMTFNFNTSGTFTNLYNVSEGAVTAAGMGEFSYGSGYTMCTPGQTYGNTPGDHPCTLYVNFSPAGVGARSGGIYISDANNNVLATHFMGGIGLGALTGIDGGSSTVLIPSTTTIGTTKLASPAGVAVDGQGNIFVADTLNARIVELPLGNVNTPPVVVSLGGATITDPKGVAVDGIGDIYIADGTGNQVVEVDVAGHPHTLLASGTLVAGTAASGINGIAVDTLGNVFVSDSGNNRQYGSISVLASSTTTFGGTALKSPAGIAVDGSDDVFIADTGNNRIVEFGQYGTTSVAAADGKTYSSPTGVAVDAAGDLYVTDANGVYALYTNGHELTLITSGISAPYGVALDTLGDVAVANTGDSNIIGLNVSSPTVAFGSETEGVTSSAASLLLYNIGNQPLTFSAAPAIDTGDTVFAITNSTTCTNGATVNPGGVCFIDVTFTPATTGAATGTITLTDNSPSGTQTISLTGTGTAGAGPASTTTTLTATPNPDPIGTTVVFKATVASGSGTPTGTVSFYLGSNLLTTSTLSSGVATYSVPTTGFPAGTFTITATYNGTSSYKTSSGNTNITLSNSVATTTTLTATPNPDVIGTSVTFKATVTAGSGTPTGTVSFYVGSSLLTTVTLSSGTASYTVPTTGLPAGTYPISATYNGATGFNKSSGNSSITLAKQVATTTVLTATPNPVTVGTNVTLKAVVTGSNPTGTVTFKLGSNSLEAVALSSGSASLTVPTTDVPPGSYVLTAVYSGDSANLASTSSNYTVVIDAK